MKKGIKEKFNQNKENMGFYNQDGTTPKQQKKNKQTKNTNKKIKPIYLTYTSDSEQQECFFDVLESINKNCTIINKFMDGIIENIYSFDDFVREISAILPGIAPQLVAKQNIHVCFSVSANRVHVRLEGNVAFTIEVKYQVIDKVAKITSCTGTIILYAKNDSLYNDLIESGWVEIEK